MTAKKVTIILIVFGVALLIAASSVAIAIYRSGFWHGLDAKFGDQHLKTSVALIELHKIRTRTYPKFLRDLKYIGDWDPIAIQSVRYVVSDAQDKYCVEVIRGWIGKPDLKMPDEFWQGTGYEPSLCN
jgi:hypothetical protein